MKKIIISKLVGEDIKKELEICGFSPHSFEKNENFTSELGFHPDISVGVAPNELVTSLNFFEKNKPLFEGAEIVISKKIPKEIYPNDVVFNGFFVGDTLVCSKYICDEMKTEAKNIVTVKQGYAKCTCAVVDSAVITADSGICTALEKNNIDHLKIEQGYVDLHGFSCGFIGGASFFDEDTLFFFGDIRKHPSVSNMIDFLKNINISAVSLGKNELYDFGGAIVIS